LVDLGSDPTPGDAFGIQALAAGAVTRLDSRADIADE
jgi:hypothetical protein